MRILCDDVREAFAEEEADSKLLRFVDEIEKIANTQPANPVGITPQLRQELMEAIQRLICEDAT